MQGIFRHFTPVGFTFSSILLVLSLSLSNGLAAEETPPVEKAEKTEKAETGDKGDPAEKAGAAKKADSAKKSESTKKAAGTGKSGASSKGRTAVINTTAGAISVKFFPDRAPKAVENFIGLATGKKEWKDPEGKMVKGRSLYKGTIFHRIIPDFMIQGGDPKGNGTGDGGYKFDDEVKPSDSFDHPGILAMANSGPNTNGSQFFITVKAAPWLNGHYTIFGEVTKGMDVVEKIVNAPRVEERPEKPVSIKDIKVK